MKDILDAISSLDDKHLNFKEAWDKYGPGIENLMDRYKKLEGKELTPNVIDAKNSLLKKIQSKWKLFPRKSDISLIDSDTSSSGSITPTPSTLIISNKPMDNSNLTVDNPFDE